MSVLQRGNVLGPAYQYTRWKTQRTLLNRDHRASRLLVFCSSFIRNAFTHSLASLHPPRFFAPNTLSTCLFPPPKQPTICSPENLQSPDAKDTPGGRPFLPGHSATADKPP